MKRIFALCILICLPAWATLVSIGGVLPWPAWTGANHDARNLNLFSAGLIDASGEKHAAIVQVPAGCTTIQQVGFRTGTVTTGDTLKIGIYTVDSANGDPTTTAYGSMTTTTVVVANADDNKWFMANIGDATATAGDLVGVVIEFNSFVSGNLNIARADVGNWFRVFPYTALFTTSWTKSTNTPVVTFECQSGTYFPIDGVWPAATVTDRAYDTVGGENDEGGNIFSVPFKCRVVGAWFYGDVNADFTVKLYGSDGSTVLASAVYDASNQAATTTGIKWVRFATAVTLTVNTNYRITLLAADSTGGTLADLDVDATAGVAMMGALPGGSAIHYTTRDGGGSWTETTTRRAMIGVLIDQLDDGAGGAAGTRVY